MNRRDFIQQSTLASSAFMIPNFLRSSDFGKIYGSRTGKTLVVIQLSGGNDGLNTIVPFEDDLYHKARPKIGIQKNEVIRLGQSDLGFNPAMSSIRSIFDKGEMSIVNSVGYPNPIRSHFRSMDIWQTGSASNEYLSTGWLGRYLDSECSDCQPHYALNMNDNIDLALKGINQSGFAIDNLEKLNRTVGNRYLKALANHHHHDHEHENVEYLYKTMIDTQSSVAYLYEKSKMHSSRVSYPKSNLGKDLKQIAELMTTDADVKIYYASLSGFDTHAQQKGKHSKLLETYSEAVSAFVKDLKQNNLFNDTLIMTFSEFGRRVAQNAGNGTDHGTANNLFLMGGNLKNAGIYNAAPNLADLDEGDLKFEIDFRRIYAEVINNWLDGNAKQILGQEFGRLGLL